VTLIANLLTRIIRWWLRQNKATRTLPYHLWRALVNFKNHGGRHAAALAYYFVFSVFPLTLLMATAISGILGPAVAQEQISTGLELFLPEKTAVLLQDNLSEALQQSTSFGLIAVGGLVWSALGLFSNLSSSLETIFRVPVGRSLWRQRLLAFVMTFILIILVIASFVASGLLGLLSTLLLDNSAWITIAITFLPLGLNMVIFALLFRYIPARPVSWDAIWPAAILGAAGWELAKIGFVWYLDNLATFSLVYGGIATVIVLMFWAFLLASILLFSAEICAQLDLWMESIQQADSLELPDSEPPQLPSEVSHRFD
jgi:membrane protein